MYDSGLDLIWGFPKIRGTFLGVPIIRTIVFWGVYWGTPYFGKLPYLSPDVKTPNEDLEHAGGETVLISPGRDGDVGHLRIFWCLNHEPL